jgi:succinate dehydrogenase/fumarate reductase cytochrome b subunit (b558 family)
LRKLHSLSGVVPVGVFLLLHLWSQSSALRGRAAYDAAFARADRLPFQPLLEILLVLVPLVFHASYGLVLTARSRPTVGAFPTSRNWMYTAQRVTGLASFGWITWHLGQTYLPRLVGEVGARQMYPALVSALSSTTGGLPVAALATVAGVGAASFHLAHGVWSAAVSWGLLSSRRAQSAAGAAAVIGGLALFALGTNTVVFFATGARWIVLGPEAPPSGEACAEAPARGPGSGADASAPREASP